MTGATPIRLAVVLVVSIASTGTGSMLAAHQDDTGAPAGSPTAAIDAAADYCRAGGGIVRERYPVLGTDGAGQIRLAGTLRFCEFGGGAGAEPPGSWIHVSLATLYAEEPTLAALAYLTRPPLPEIPPSVNPASVYCSHLEGSDQVGGATAGGWVTDDTDSPIDVLQACVFPDLSAIDSWGLTYHADGTIRGADLTPLLRYHPTQPPDVFAR